MRPRSRLLIRSTPRWRSDPCVHNERTRSRTPGAGLTYCRRPLALEPEDLAGVDVAILGAPFDEGVSFRPGTRFGPRAIRQAEDVGGPSPHPHMELGIDPFSVLNVADYGDIEGAPANLAASHAQLHR